jgi:hypothetical protein
MWTNFIGACGLQAVFVGILHEVNGRLGLGEGGSGVGKGLRLRLGSACEWDVAALLGHGVSW